MINKKNIFNKIYNKNCIYNNEKKIYKYNKI